MSLLEIIVLAVVQGLTEFLPVSSSGHLVVANAVLTALGWPPTEDLLEVNIVLHLGTLVSVLLFYAREVAQMVTRDRRVLYLVLVGTLPAVLVGLPLKMQFDAVLESPLLAGCMFPVTAGVLVWASRLPVRETTPKELSYRAALGIGCMQAFALLPGISRSGSTIAGGLAAGLTRQSAGTFAFLLAIPAIAGPGLIEVAKLARNLSGGELSGGETAAIGTDPMSLAIGGVIAGVVGYGALSLLIRWVQRGRLAMFAWYLVPLGIVVVAWQLWEQSQLSPGLAG